MSTTHSQQLWVEAVSRLTCDDDLGIIRLHVAVVPPGPLCLPLLLGLLCIKRVGVVLQDDQL